MYLYDDIDEAMLADRTAEFRAQCARRLAGEITEEQFKPVRLMNGLYLQLHAYMLRIAIPYGTLNVAQLRKLAYVAPVELTPQRVLPGNLRERIRFNGPTVALPGER